MPELVQVQPLALLPTQAGCAVFLGDGDKAIVFYIDPAIGASIHGHLQGESAPRPLTHDLYRDTLTAFGAKVSRMVIVRMDDDIYYARLILEAENEIMERKIIELDCRPSDGIAVACRCEAPVFVVRELWERLEDMSDLLRQLQEQAGGEDFPEF
ncbi:MAG: bifunctional nuclease family protein [Akkermansiaceae bacterium]|nr:bifunctional nuclease family protein [Akkermansiaceae bacterium]